MKTVEQLVADLGQWFDICGNWHEFHVVREYLSVKVKDENGKLYISFCSTGDASIHVAIMDMPFVYVKHIMDYISNTDAADWFAEGKVEENNNENN